ncbi:MAG: carbohydrate kinase [Alphaproteobacteria bacterium]|nr:carbohydrate kinase [Alphaproteobacteria bacterium]
MSGDLLVGLDAGTSVIKAVAFTTAGEQVGTAAIANAYARTPDGGAEQDMARTWADAARTLRLLAGRVPDLARRLVVVAVTGQGDGTWLVDGAGDPVGAAWLWLDARAAPLVEEIRAGAADAARFAATGTGLAACQQGAQLAWMRRHRPELPAAAAAALHCKDWLYLRLTGRCATDPSEGTLTFGDFRTRAYSDAAIDALGIGPLRRLLPPIVDGAVHHDPLTPAAARATGLRAGTPVVLGYIDIACSLLGAGLYDGDGGTGCSVLGSTGIHARLARDAGAVSLTPARTGYTIALPVAGAYAQMQSNLAATLNIDWMLDLIAGVLRAAGVERDRGSLIAGLDDLVEAAAPGTLLFHPYIADGGERGPFIDAAARAGFYGLSARHGHGDLVRGIYEGLGFAARDCYGAMGGIPAEVRLSGGAARSRALRAITAAALGVPVRVSARAEAGAAGAAMIAAVALGVHRDMDACVGEWVRPLLGAAQPPDAGLAARYARLFPSYLQAREAMAPVWRSLAACGRGADG